MDRKRFRVVGGAAAGSGVAYHLSPDETEPLDSYGRSSNPTWRQLESALAELEGAATALTFGSGMAAITSALRVLAKSGAKLVVPADGYYQVRRYAAEYLAPRVTVVEAVSADMCAASSDADVVLAETPVNPGLDVVDLHHLAMTCRGRGVDRRQHHRDTAWPATVVAWCRPGGGQRDQSAVGTQRSGCGYVAGSQPELMDALERDRLLAGPVLGAFEAWLVLRSLGSAGLRFERQCQNAQALAVMLRAHPAVRRCAIPVCPTIRRIRSPRCR